MFWRKKKEAAGDAIQAVGELADASLTIGPTGVLLLLGAAAAGAAATYYVTRQKKKAAL
jgi:hypothetical protein